VAAPDDVKLTEKQRLFCRHYMGSFNATRAAIEAGYSRDTAGQIGYQLLQKASVQRELHRLKGTVDESLLIGLPEIWQELSSIAFDDIGNYLRFCTVKVETGVDEEGNPLFGYEQMVEFKDSSTIDTRNIAEISMSDKGQLKLKLQSRDTALYRMVDIVLKLRSMDIAMLKLEAALQMQGDNPEDAKSNFIEALMAETPSVWGQGDDESE